MRMSVLGRTAIELPDGQWHVSPGTERRLLAALALDTRRVWTTDDLADALFGNDAGGVRSKTVRNRVSELRARYGPNLIRTVGSGYQVGDEVTVDADEFVTVARRTDLPAGTLREALGSWRGRAYEDIEDWPEAAPAIARLELFRLHLEEHLVAVELEEGGSPQSAAATLELLVAAQPFRERRWGLLMRAYAMAGQRRDAADVYRRAHVALAEAGLTPGAELRALEAEILDDHGTVGPIASRRSGGLPFPVATMIGRESEILRIRELLGSNRIVTIIGFGGLGKTRLANHVAHERCAETDRLGVMIDLAGARSDDDAYTLAASALGVAIRGSAREVIAAWRPDAPHLVVLDNCESFVNTAAEIANLLAASSQDLLVLATSRVPLGVPGEMTLTLNPLHPVDSVSLLCRDSRDELDLESAGLLCSLLDHVPLAIRLCAAALEATSAEELASMLRADIRAIDRISTSAQATGDLAQLHTGLATMIHWSIDRLSPRAQTALCALSPVAATFTLDALQEIAGLVAESGLAFQIVKELVRSSLVQIEPGRPTRYRLLDSTRSVANGLISDAQRTGAEQRFTNWAAGLVQRTEIDDVLRLVPEIANLLAAGALACDRGWVDQALCIADAARPLQMAEHFELVELETRAVGLPGATSHRLFDKVCTMAAQDNFWARSNPQVALELNDRIAALSSHPRPWVEHLRGFATGDLPRVVAALPLAVAEGDDLATLAILSIQAAITSASDPTTARGAAHAAGQVADRVGTGWAREMALMAHACAFAAFDPVEARAALAELEALAATTGLTGHLSATRSVLAGSIRDDDHSRLELGLQSMTLASTAGSSHWFALACWRAAAALLRLGNRRTAALLAGGAGRYTAVGSGLGAAAGLGELDFTDEHDAYLAGARLTMAELVAAATAASLRHQH